MKSELLCQLDYKKAMFCVIILILVCIIVGELFSVKSDDKRPKAVNKRVWASIEREQEEVINDLFLEGLRRDPEKKKLWVCLVDGDLSKLRKCTLWQKNTPLQ